MTADPGSLRVDRVAQQAAANKRMIYHYFGDRAGLLQAVYDRQLKRLLIPQTGVSAGTRRIVRLLLSERAAGVVDSEAEAQQ